jgi:chromosome partitioning protein
MQVIAFASRKGGAGKTTLAAHLAVQAEAAGHGPVSLIDTDPQAGLAAWWNVRQATTPLWVEATTELAVAVAAVRARPGLLFVDTPPSVSETIAEVIAVSDLVVIPVRPSPNDLRAVGSTIAIAKRAKCRMVFVINGATQRARITAETAIALSQHGTVAPVMVHHRVDFAGAMTDGRTCSELDPASRSAAEIAGLWSYIHNILIEDESYGEVGTRAA